MAKKFLAFGDMHVPYHNEIAVEIVKKIISIEKPDITVMMGDMLDCGQFSAHPPTWGIPDSEYENDLQYVNDFIDYSQKYTNERTVYIEGNHEFRVDRWAAKTSEGRGAYNLLAPRIQISRNRKKFTFVKYGGAEGKYPHYKLNSRIVCVHGWSYALNATKNHLRLSQGKSIIHGHTHALESVIMPDLWGSRNIQGSSTGCLCELIPRYGIGNPTRWVNGFIIGYLGKYSDTMYSVDIKNNFCVLPGGREVRV